MRVEPMRGFGCLVLKSRQDNRRLRRFKDMENKVYAVEVKVTQREVKNGAEKGKKFMAYQIFNKKTNYFEELRFNKKVKELPETEGSFIIEVESTEINRQANNRKWPLTWISGIVSISTLTDSQANKDQEEKDDLPF